MTRLSTIRRESGQALPLALAVMTIVALLTAALTLNGATNQRNSLKSADSKAAFALASTTLAYAQGKALAGDLSYVATTGTVSAPNNQTGSWTAAPYADNGCNCTWTITATGTVDGVTRVITEVATKQSDHDIYNPNVWNYLYSDAAGCTTINGNVTISVPLLLRGSLCLSGSQVFNGSQLKMGGSLTMSGNAKIGSSSTKIDVLQVGGTCVGVTPGTGACDGSHSPVYAKSASPSLDVTPQMPCIGQPNSWDPLCTTANGNNGNWVGLTTVYSNQAALAKTGCPANLLDNDSTLNNSDASISSVMFGNTDYDCKVGSNEIKWNHSAKTLFVNGTIYFDGSLSLSGNIVYSGLASLYFTGGVSGGSNSSFCGIASCTASWNTNANAIVFVAGCWANSTGSSLTTSGCVSLTGGAKAQFGAYVTTNYYVDGNSANYGPILSNSLSLNGGTSSLIPFSQMPPGTPLNYDITHSPATIQSWSG
jgi:hypothetical protein